MISLFYSASEKIKHDPLSKPVFFPLKRHLGKGKRIEAILLVRYGEMMN